MYKDDQWYRKLVRDVEEHRSDFTAKQWQKYRMEFMLRLALRIKDASDACETCRDFQHTLTRLEEEFLELPGSKAQRSYQDQQLRLMGEHFAKTHHLTPPRYYLRLYAYYGLIAGMLAGIILGLMALGNGIYLPAGTVAGLLLGGLYGNAEDTRANRERRTI